MEEVRVDRVIRVNTECTGTSALDAFKSMCNISTDAAVLPDGRPFDLYEETDKHTISVISGRRIIIMKRKSDDTWIYTGPSNLHLHYTVLSV